MALLISAEVAKHLGRIAYRQRIFETGCRLARMKASEGLGIQATGMYPTADS